MSATLRAVIAPRPHLLGAALIGVAGGTMAWLAGRDHLASSNYVALTITVLLGLGFPAWFQHPIAANLVRRWRFGPSVCALEGDGPRAGEPLRGEVRVGRLPIGAELRIDVTCVHGRIQSGPGRTITRLDTELWRGVFVGLPRAAGAGVVLAFELPIPDAIDGPEGGFRWWFLDVRAEGTGYKARFHLPDDA
jgi:hypothetical protein